MFWTQQRMSTYSQPSFSSSTWKRGGVWMCELGVIYLENGWRQRLSYYRVLIGSHICCVDWYNGWPWVTLNEHASRAVSAVAEVLVIVVEIFASEFVVHDSPCTILYLIVILMLCKGWNGPNWKWSSVTSCSACWVTSHANWPSSPAGPCRCLERTELESCLTGHKDWTIRGDRVKLRFALCSRLDAGSNTFYARNIERFASHQTRPFRKQNRIKSTNLTK